MSMFDFIIRVNTSKPAPPHECVDDTGAHQNRHGRQYRFIWASEMVTRRANRSVMFPLTPCLGSFDPPSEMPSL